MKRAWEILWRLSILLLPWQTRWFLDAQLAGWPWEQGRMSIYASWMLLIATIVVGYLYRRGGPMRPPRSTRRSIPTATFIVLASLFVMTIIATRLDPIALRATFQWWIQIALIVAFVITLKRNAIAWTTLAAWFVVSLLPHVALGFVQYAMQQVNGSTLLGIASQLPENAGVSVVEHGVYRVLRIYGGFPHPNIFGGWLVIGILTAFLLAARSEKKSQALFAIFSSAAMSVALLLTYSRSAWVAAVVGCIVLVGATLVVARAGTRPAPTKQFLFAALVASILSVGIVGYSQRDHIFARGDTSSRLETKSLDVRAQALQNGWDVFRGHPFVGTAPGAQLYRLAEKLAVTKTDAPLEPPHNVSLLALADLGIVGMGLLIALIYLAKRRRPMPDAWTAMIYLAPFFLIGLFDHYPWSLWSGQCLVFVSYLLATMRDSGS
jgi:hypothetical protein